MSALSLSSEAGLRRLLGDRTLVKATLAINAGGAVTIKNTGAIIYTVNGIAYTKAALAAQLVTPTHNYRGDAVAGSLQTAAPYLTTAPYAQPPSTTVYYVVALDASGNVAIIQGSYAGQQIVNPLDNNKNATGQGGLPNVPVGFAPVGYFTVVTNSSTTFTPNTSLLDAVAAPAVFYDVSVLPAL